jgi:hypothetical protein
LDFQKQEEDLIAMSASVYPYSDLSHQQKSSIIRFTLSIGTYFQSQWASGTDDKRIMNTILDFFKSFVAVLSLCLGGLPNLSTGHSLDSGGCLTLENQCI